MFYLQIRCLLLPLNFQQLFLQTSPSLTACLPSRRWLLASCKGRGGPKTEPAPLWEGWEEAWDCLCIQKQLLDSISSDKLVLKRTRLEYLTWQRASSKHCCLKGCNSSNQKPRSLIQVYLPPFLLIGLLYIQIALFLLQWRLSSLSFQLLLFIF